MSLVPAHGGGEGGENGGGMHGWQADSRVLLVEDDDLLRESLSERLGSHGFLMETALNGEEALERAGSERFDLILLDVRLPDLDGRQVCRRMRDSGMQTPVIMLTAAASDTDAIQGLDSGANDYITKPFRVPVLLAHMRAHLRQHEMTEDAEFDVGPFRYRPSAKVLVGTDGGRIRLTEKENGLLKCLLRADRPVSRSDLLDEIWGYHPSVASHTLETHIYRLRRKMEVGRRNPRLLVTEDGGYRLLRTPVPSKDCMP